MTVNIELHWIDDQSNSYYIDTGDSLTAIVQNVGPIDISALSSTWDGNMAELWIELIGSNVPVNVRIGWVKLTE